MKKELKEDISYSILKVAIGSIPLVGATATELFQLLVSPPLEKRRDKWMFEIGESLKYLEQNQGLDLNALSSNETFIDVVLQATQLAIRTSEKDKITFYRNAILNTAMNTNPEVTEIQIFLNFVSTFTVWHIKILKLFDNPKEWFDKNEIKFSNYLSAGLSNVLEAAFPELIGKKELYNLIWDDLARASLHNSTGMDSMMSGASLLVPRTTAFGRDFLKFITEYPIS